MPGASSRPPRDDGDEARSDRRGRPGRPAGAGRSGDDRGRPGGARGSAGGGDRRGGRPSAGRREYDDRRGGTGDGRRSGPGRPGGSRPSGARGSGPRPASARPADSRSSSSRPGGPRSGSQRSGDARSAGPRAGGPRAGGSRPGGSRPEGSRFRSDHDASEGSSRHRGESDRPRAGGRRDDGRSGGRSGAARPGGSRPGSGGSRSGAGGPRTGSGGGRAGAARSGGARSGAPRGGRPGGRRPEAPVERRPLTAAEQRAAEVRARRGPRTPRDEQAEAQRIADRQLEQWIDEGEAGDDIDDIDDIDLRSAAAGAVQRGDAGGDQRGPRELTPEERERRQKQAISRVDPELAAEIRAATADPRAAARTVERVGRTQEALDRDRLDEARRTINPIAKNLPGVAGVQELAGLVAYRLGRWRDAVRSIEAAQALRTNVEVLPVLADAYRALRRWDAVERTWREIKELSPSHEVMAEGRIVAAGALADQGDLTAALAVMTAAPTKTRRAEGYHLRQWYVLGDLHDRAGNPIEAAHWFERIAAVDDDYFDVPERLGALGRRRR